MKTPTGAVFLTWNDSRRSVSLAEILDMSRVVFVARRRGALRHALGLLATGLFLLRRRPRLVWYQFSHVLGLLLAIYARLGKRRRIRLIADIHTKALRRRGSPGLAWLVTATKGWALRSCCFTLVTNEQNAAYGRRLLGISPLVLPDPLPTPPQTRLTSPAADVVFICSFASDEPVRLIADVCRRLGTTVSAAATGDPTHLVPRLRRELQATARLTGYLAESEYWSLLRSARCVVVLSTEPACLPSGGYEAIAIGHRPVLAADPIAEAVFGPCAIYSVLEADAIVAAIRGVLETPSATDAAAPGVYRGRWQQYWDAVAGPLTSCTAS